MNSKNIDIINIVLIFVSLLIAILFPFKLFLFSYAVLGPLHYLTEINWLNDNNFFISKNKNKRLFYVTLAILIAVIAFSSIFIRFTEDSILYKVTDLNFLLAIILFFSTSLILFKKIFHLFLSFVFSILLSLLLQQYYNSSLLFLGLFIPTIIHVYIFTLLFMIYGALKSKSKLGFTSAILLLLVLAFIYFIDISFLSYRISEYTDKIFTYSTMPKIINSISIFLGENKEYTANALTVIAIKIQIFIAFAYTYHYLNWFSKTSIIGWKDALSKKKIYLIIYIWIVSLIIYIRNFEMGYTILFTLSYIHVLLELPLNVITIKELFLIPKKILQKNINK